MDCSDFDGVLLLSFGGPEAPEQVMPFLENVTRGRGIPRERLAAVAEHYLHFGGVSPINGINRALITQLEAELTERGLALPVYFGNRNWEPYVEETVAAMRDNGIRRAAVFTTSAWGGYSSCTQYIEDIARGRAAAGDRAPELVKLRQYFDHPLFVEMFVEAIADAARTLPAEQRAEARLMFTAHSIPMAARSRCGTDLYARQVAYASGLVATPRDTPTTTRCGSRGPGRPRCRGWNPTRPTSVGPRRAGTKAVIVCPIGFVADHIEVVWDLDHELRELAQRAWRRVREGGDPERRPRSRAWPST